MPQPFARFLFLGLCLLIGTSLSAQNQELIDSLEAAIPSTFGTQKVDLFNELVWNYRSLDPEKSKEYAQESINMAKYYNYDKGLAQAYNDLGIIYYDEKDYREALSLYERSMEIRERLEDQVGIASLHNKMGIIFQEMGDYPRALDNQLACLQIYEEMEWAPGISYSLGNVAVIYQNLEQYEEALEYHFRANELSVEMQDTLVQARTLINIGSTYFEMGMAEEAKLYYQQAEPLMREHGDAYNISTLLNNLGAIYKDENDFARSEAYLKEALEMRRESGNIKGEASTLINYGGLKVNMQQVEEGKAMLEQAIQLARSVGAKPERLEAYKAMTELYTEMEDFEAALDYNQRTALLKDSMLNEASNKEVLTLQTLYNTDKMAEEIEGQQVELKRQKTQKRLILIISLALIALVALGAYFFYYRYKLKQEAALERSFAREREERFKAVIEAEEKERKRIAQDLHDSLGQMLSSARLNVSSLEDVIEHGDEEDQKVFDNSLQLIDEAVKEVRHVSHNMMPSALIKLGLVSALRELIDKVNAAGQLKVELEAANMDARFDESKEVALYRITQEILNNTIKHSGASQVSVQLDRNNGHLELQIKDNGKGLNEDAIAKSSGIGWKNIYSRLAMLNGSMDIQAKNGEGTLISIKAQL